MIVPQRQSWTFRTSRRFWLREDLSLNAKGLAAVLLSFACRNGFAYPTTPQLSKAAGISRNTTEKLLHELLEKGVISWHIWKDEHGQKRRLFALDPYTQNLVH